MTRKTIFYSQLIIERIGFESAKQNLKKIVFCYRSPKECVNDVISLCDASPTPLSCLVLGEANLWKFILEHEDICKQVSESCLVLGEANLWKFI